MPPRPHVSILTTICEAPVARGTISGRGRLQKQLASRDRGPGRERVTRSLPDHLIQAEGFAACFAGILATHDRLNKVVNTQLQHKTNGCRQHYPCRVGPHSALPSASERRCGIQQRSSRWGCSRRKRRQEIRLHSRREVWRRNRGMGVSRVFAGYKTAL